MRIRADLLATEEKLRKQTDLFEQVIADKDCNFGLDPSWVKIYPYQMVIKPGETARGEIRVQNYRSGPMKMEVALVLPEGWISQPDVLRFEAPAHGHASSAFTLRTTRERPRGQTRIAIAADVMADGKYLGQIIEAAVDLPADGSPPARSSSGISLAGLNSFDEAAPGDRATQGSGHAVSWQTSTGQRTLPLRNWTSKLFR
jgi:hypothetical protein